MPVFECTRCNDMTYSSSAGAVQPCARCGSLEVRTLPGAFADARASVRDLAPADHAALVYDTPDAVARFCARFLAEGVDADERVMATVPSNLREAVEDVLDPAAAVDVEWHDCREIYGDFDPDRIATTYEAMIAEEERPTRILAGLDAECANGVEVEHFDRYERLAHAVVTDQRATVVCVFDTKALPEGFVDVAMRRHRLTASDAGVRRNDLFEYEPA